MSISSAIFSRLSTYAPLVALVADRVYPVEAPANVLIPYVIHLTVVSPKVNSISGPSNVANPRVQIDGYATTYGLAVTIGVKVREALDGWRGVSGTVTVLGSLCVDSREFYEDAANPPLYRISQDFSIWHRD